jgi:hypothetical protein
MLKSRILATTGRSQMEKRIPNFIPEMHGRSNGWGYRDGRSELDREPW